MGKLRKLSTGDLLAIALSSSSRDDEAYWDAVSTLRKRATPKIYKIARCLCRSSNPNARVVGIDILAQFGHRIRHYPLRKRRIRFLLKMLEAETDPEALNSLGVAFGHLYTPCANPALIRLKNHPDAQVRYGVAFGLYTIENVHPDAIAALIELSADRDADVRDWATFALGAQLDLDTPAIREALFARLSDSHPPASDEAFLGLSKRKDERVFAPIVAGLEQMTSLPFFIEAATEFSDARLLPVLRNIQADWLWRGVKKNAYAFKELRRAIRACEAGT
jgi:HEAT repeat protein